MAAAPTYLHNIHSLLQSNPTLPVLGTLDVNQAIIINTPIDPTSLTNAKVVAAKLKATLESPINPGVTEKMVQSAELRVNAIERAHATAEYGALGPEAETAEILARLDTMQDRQIAIENSIAAISANIRLTNAMTHNQRVLRCNGLTQPNCQPLQKTISGHGLELARAIAQANEQRGLIAPQEPAAIGAIPENFITNIASYTCKDISTLVIFYNDDFGILVDDDEATRRLKLILFLSRY